MNREGSHSSANHWRRTISDINMLCSGLFVVLVTVSVARPTLGLSDFGSSTAIATKQRCLRSLPSLMLPQANHLESNSMYVFLQHCIPVSH